MAVIEGTDEYWAEKHAWRQAGDRCPDGARVARASGRRYVLMPPDPVPVTPAPMRGSSGIEVTVRFHDGAVVTTNDLWEQGAMARRWRSRLPDNARFLAPVGLPTL